MEIGGIERSLINMLEKFDYEKYHVELLIFEHKGEFMNLIPKPVNILPEIAPYTVFRKPITQCIKEGHTATSLIRIMVKYASFVKAKKNKLKEGSAYIQMQLAVKYSSYVLPKLKKEYDLAISYAWPHDIVANNISAHKKMAWIHTDYGSLEVDRKVDLAAWKKFDYIASVSEECSRSFLSVYPSLNEKVRLIENITSPEFISRMSKSEQANVIKDSDFNLISVGRYSYVKGFDMAIKALKILHDKGYPEIKWYVVGYGGQEEELKELIIENKLEKSFILLGKKENPYPYIRSSDIYVQPSRYEGKAVTVTEAKILGKPIIITSYPTASSQINHNVDGMICDMSPQGLADAIETLYLDPQLRATFVTHLEGQEYLNSNELDKLYEIV